MLGIIHILYVKLVCYTFKLNNLKCTLIYFYSFVKMSIQKDTKIQCVNKESEFSAHITMSFFAKHFEFCKKDFRLDGDVIWIFFSFCYLCLKNSLYLNFRYLSLCPPCHSKQQKLIRKKMKRINLKNFSFFFFFYFSENIKIS